MTFTIHSLRTSKQLFVLLLWVIFVGFTVWLHTERSQQPPIHDAATYYQKAYHFWIEIHKHKLFNPFNVEPSFRPPGTILMSYPFGFDTDYRGFYFRSIFFPIALLSLAVVICGYQRELDNKSKWHLVLFAAFLSTLPCFYEFERSSTLLALAYWGLVDNFLAGVAALAAAATIRSIWTQSLVWVGLAAVLSSFCLLIKPTGALIMMLIGVTWFGLAALKLKLVWQSPDERKSTSRWLLRGMIIFAIPYLIVLAGSFTSHYLSSQNLAFGNAAIIIMQTEIRLSWSDFQNIIHKGLGYPFLLWFLLIIILIGHYLWRTPIGSFLWSKTLLIGLVLASSITLIFGIWFWIFGSGGITQIRYFTPFILITVIFALPVILTAMRAMPNWKIVILSILMIAPVINMALLLPQHNASVEWQKWTGVNLTSGASNPVADQAQNLATTIKQEGRNITFYSMSLGVNDSIFQSVIDYARIKMPPMPDVLISRPIDWLHPSTYRKEEMLDADYWLFSPVRDPNIMSTVLATSTIDTLQQETALFQAWATQLSTNEGVTVVSNTPVTRVLRITDKTRLESAFNTLVDKHHWRNTFMDANPKRKFTEQEMVSVLASNPSSIENITFADRFHLRTLSVNHTGDNITVSFWWKPLSPMSENDWTFFIHLIDSDGKIVLATGVPVHFNRSLSSLNNVFLFDQITFTNPIKNKTHQLAFGFIRPNQTALVANKGTRDWNNQRVIVPLP